MAECRRRAVGNTDQLAFCASVEDAFDKYRNLPDRISQDMANALGEMRRALVRVSEYNVSRLLADGRRQFDSLQTTIAQEVMGRKDGEYDVEFTHLGNKQKFATNWTSSALNCRRRRSACARSRTASTCHRRRADARSTAGAVRPLRVLPMDRGLLRHDPGVRCHCRHGHRRVLRLLRTPAVVLRRRLLCQINRSACVLRVCFSICRNKIIAVPFGSHACSSWQRRRSPAVCSHWACTRNGSCATRWRSRPIDPM